jgi:hypothetical protein
LSASGTPDAAPHPTPLTPKTGFVCVLDLLGSKERWGREAPESVVARMRELYNVAIEEYKTDSFYRSNVHTLVSGFIAADWEVHFLSDTMLITGSYSGTDPQSYVNQLANHQIIVFFNALKLGFLPRGAISYGEYYQEREIVVGPAINEAARWAEVAEWAGVLLTPSAAEYVENAFKPSEVRAGLEFAPWNVPLKTGAVFGTYALWWPRDEQRNRLVELFDVGPKTVDVALKRQNTLAFYDEMYRLTFGRVKPRPADTPLPRAPPR